MSLDNAVWIVLGIAIALAVVLRAASWLRSDQDPDLGSVSHQWISEQGLGRGHDPHR
jgi:hypothetical protein